MTVETLLIVLFTGLLSTGLYLTVDSVVASRRLSRRIAPYLVDISTVAEEEAAGLRVRLRRQAARSAGEPSELEAKLMYLNTRSGKFSLRLEEFRLLRVLLAAAAFLAVLALLPLLDAFKEQSIVLHCAVAGILAAIVYLLPEKLLDWFSSKYRQRLAAELPTMLDFLALSVSSGESLIDSFRRISQFQSGVLPRELRRLVALHSAGSPLHREIKELGQRTGSPELRRIGTQLISGMERGAPLAKILRDAAHDLRQAERTALLESAGKKEVAMMIPLVFMILPIVVLFAIYPGIVSLRIGF